MILQEFSKYLQTYEEDITLNKTSATRVLCDWICKVVHKNPKNHIDKIIHQEITFAQNGSGDFLIVGNSPSGRVLVKALYNYALSYENFLMSRRLEVLKPKDFNKNNKNRPEQK